jgi:hypothetical protein
VSEVQLQYTQGNVPSTDEDEGISDDAIKASFERQDNFEVLEVKVERAKQGRNENRGAQPARVTDTDSSGSKFES